MLFHPGKFEETHVQKFTLLAVLSLVAMIGMSIPQATQSAEEAEEKVNIKVVMKKAMKSGLAKKAATGAASDEEKEALLELVKHLESNKPPKGDAESWDAKTKALSAAAAAVAEGKEGAGAELGAAMNCKGCHSAHK